MVKTNTHHQNLDTKNGRDMLHGTFFILPYLAFTKGTGHDINFQHRAGEKYISSAKSRQFRDGAKISCTNPIMENFLYATFAVVPN